MRWFHTTVIVVVLAAILIFAVQNLASITVSFLGLRISAPLAVVVAIVYVLGMATGGSAWSLMRWAWRGSRQTQVTGA